MKNIQFLFILFSIIINVYTITSPYGWKNRISLSGLWKFKLSSEIDPDAGFREKWYSKPLEGDILYMPVPASYNDVTTNTAIRDFLGWAWYQTENIIDVQHWSESRVVIHFGGVHYNTVVWFGDKLLGTHEGGHVPFEFELTGSRGLITVAVNNTLNNYTIPQGFLSYPSPNVSFGRRSYTHDFDYFDYAGINRNVFLYRTSKEIYVEDVIIETTYSNKIGYVKFNVLTKFGILTGNSCLVSLYDSLQSFNITKCQGIFNVSNPILWWDVSSKHKPNAYLYTLSIEVNPGNYAFEENVYEMKVGIRNIKWNTEGLWLNDEKLYLHGFGKHEDSELRGRGFDWVTAIRDMDLLLWTGANVVRTTHYPHSIEWVDIADRVGMLLILESPACSLSNFDDKMLQQHKKLMVEIYTAYGTHPSIIMWSLANEPFSNNPLARKYFSELHTSLRSIDSTRPITFVTGQHVDNDKAAGLMDIICLNRYYGWYSYPGDELAIEGAVIDEVQSWRKAYNLPLIITEYGAGSIPGVHVIPSTMWSEEYQVDLLKHHFTAFDKLRANGSLSGELLWVFADFATPQEYIRPGACMKGIFTRSRQPKKAAYTVKLRYETVLNGTEEELYNFDMKYVLVNF